MKDEGEDANKWLKTITKDQNLEDLDNITLTRWDGFRRWFVSRILSPNLYTGFFNPNTGRIVLGPHGFFTPTVTVVQTSAATSTLTCAAGRRYRVYAATAINDTRADTVTLAGNLDAQAITYIGYDSSSASPMYVVGGLSQNGATDNLANGPEFIWMEAGDTLTMTLAAFVAADDVEFVWYYESYAVT